MRDRCAHLSVSNIAWAGEADELYFRLLSTLGVQGVELAASLVWPEPTTTTARQRRKYRDYVSSFGLRISGLASLLYSRNDLQLLATGADQRNLIEYLKKTINLCLDLGGKYLVFGRPQNRKRGGLPIDEAIKRSIAVFQEVGEYAEKGGCAIGIEALPAPGCDFITCLREAFALVSEINSRGVCLHLDTGAAEGANDQDIETSSLATLLANVQSCQINDHELRPPGSAGHNLHDVWSQGLVSANYKGWLAIEMRKESGGNISEHIHKAVEFVRDAYRTSLTGHV